MGRGAGHLEAGRRRTDMQGALAPGHRPPPLRKEMGSQLGVCHLRAGRQAIYMNVLWCQNLFCDAAQRVKIPPTRAAGDSMRHNSLPRHVA